MFKGAVVWRAYRSPNERVSCCALESVSPQARPELSVNTSRRQLLSRMYGVTGFALAVMLVPRSARACLVGRWKVRCPNGHVDVVEEVTCNHTCEKCGVVAFSGGVGQVVCPKGHSNQVTTGDKSGRAQWLCSFKCRVDGLECRLDANDRVPEHCAE